MKRSISHFFIDRPAFAMVISIVITIVGIVGYLRLPVAQYPNVVPPSVVVRTSYPGASPEILMNTVAAPLEQEINGVEKMLYMASQCSSDGSVLITITFEVGTNLDMAQVLVQNRVAIATPRLPEEVRNIGVVVKKRSPDMLVSVNLFSPDGSRDKLYLTNYAISQMNDRLARIQGVGDLEVLGPREYSMRVWVNPDKLSKYRLTPSAVVKALREQNRQVAAGALNQAPDANPDLVYELVINTQGRFTKPSEFGEIIIKYTDDGKVVKLKDVARVELDSYDYTTDTYLNGKPCVGISIYQLPGTNALDTAERISDMLEEMKANFPAGVDYEITIDNTLFIKSSVNAVYRTIFEAVLLVVFVIVLFLQNWRSSLIPLTAIPVSLIGTFGFMDLLGFSINNISLFGIALAIGIVVDNAIVIVENVERNMKLGMGVRQATKDTMDHVQNALVAITLVLSAVFVPTAFVEGISGQFYKQFALTIAVSTILSGVVSLTLSPALCVLLIKENGERPDFLTRAINFAFGWAFAIFNRSFEWLSDKYGRAVYGIVRHWVLAIFTYVLMLVLTGYLFSITPSGFIPKQDNDFLQVSIQLPEGYSLRETDKVMKRMQELLKDIDGIEKFMCVVGLNGATRTKSSNTGALFIKMDPKLERMKRGLDINRMMAAISKKLNDGLPESSTFILTPPAVRGIGVGGDFRAQVQDRVGLGVHAIEKYTNLIVERAKKSEAIADAFTTFSVDSPQLYVDIDRERAQKLNVPISSVFETMQYNLGSIYVNDFNILNRVYRVKVQAEGQKRSDLRDIYNLKVPTVRGANVPLGSVADVRRIIGPARVSRFNLYPCAEVIGALAPGHSTGEAIAEIEKIAAEVLPDGMGIEWTDLAFQEKRMGNTSIYVFALCVVFVYLMLVALYEDWKLPMSVILVVPLVLLFAIIAVLGRSLDNNLMTQVGFIVLIGLACKNAILIVEFAKLRQERGEDPASSVAEASRNRLRPILMTSFAFILGVVPLAYGTDSGAELREALGTSVLYGMIGVTFLGLIFTPAFYYAIQRNKKYAKIDAE